MTKALKKEFNQGDLEAADKYLAGLADKLLETVQQKVDQDTLEESDEGLGTVVTLTDDSFKGLTLKQLRTTAGYARLNDVCSDVNACLEEPFPLYKAHDKEAPAERLQVFLQQPYDKSRAAHKAAEDNPDVKKMKSKSHGKKWAKSNKPGN